MPEWTCKDDSDEVLSETSGETWEEWQDDEVLSETGGETWEEWQDDEVLGQPGGETWEQWQDDEVLSETWEEWQDDKVLSETGGETWEEEQDDQVLGQPGGKTWEEEQDDQVLGQPGDKTWEEEHEETIRKTQELLDRLRRRPPPWKRGRSPQRQEPPHPPSKKIKTGRRRSDKASSSCAKSEFGQVEFIRVDVRELRFSQLSCKETFSCGRTIEELVQKLADGRVDLSARFLQLTVFEDTDPRTNETILRCIDNRRLVALKKYAEKSGQDVLVNAHMINKELVQQVRRCINNTDDTDGRDLRLRKKRKQNNNPRPRYRPRRFRNKK